jgi:hypothetical protein
MHSRKFLIAWASFDTAPSKRMKPLYTSIGISVHSSQYTDKGRGVNLVIVYQGRNVTTYKCAVGFSIHFSMIE